MQPNFPPQQQRPPYSSQPPLPAQAMPGQMMPATNAASAGPMRPPVAHPMSMPPPQARALHSSQAPMTMPPGPHAYQAPPAAYQGRPPMPGRPMMPPAAVAAAPNGYPPAAAPPAMAPTPGYTQQPIPAAAVPQAVPVDPMTQQMQQMQMQSASPMPQVAPGVSPRASNRRVYPSQQQGPVVNGMPPMPQAGVPAAQPTQQGVPPPASLQQQPGYPQQQPAAQAPAYPQQPPMAQPQQQQQQQPGRPKIDPNQIPSAVEWQQADQTLWDAQEFRTSCKNVPPLVTTEFLSVDDGNACPRFIRASSYEIPCSGELVNNSQIPLSLVIQPLAELRSIEAPVETVDLGPEGPIRCSRCKAYMNPFMRWMNGGHKFICNICDFPNDTPPSYFCPTDMSGRRADTDTRPELRCGVVEYVATKEFCMRDPAPASFVFLIDVSCNAVQNGMINVFVETIKEMLELFPTDDEDNCPCTVGFVAFDKAAHYFNLSPTLAQPAMMIVPDVDDLFVPLHTGFLVNPITSKDQIVNMLDQLPKIFAGNRTVEACVGSAVKATSEHLMKTGGRIIVLQHSLPIYGPGALKLRDDPKLIGTDKEKTLFAPQDGFYKDLGEKCVERGVGVDLFLFANGYVDVATVGCLSVLTGGQSFLYPSFNAQKDGIRFAEDLRRIITRPFGFDCLLRVRCSNGLRVDEHFGNFYMRSSTDVEAGIMDSESAFAVTLKHEAKLEPQSQVSFQIALLYTTPFGKRVIRLINYQLRVTDQLSNVFRFADVDTTLNVLAKIFVSQTLKTNLNTVRETFTEKCVAILVAYRKFCATSSSPSQLVLPECYKLLPIFGLGVLKSLAFRGGSDISPDIRVHEMRLVRGMGVSSSAALYYPRMLSLHDMPAEACEYDPAVNRFRIPNMHRPSWARIQSYGAYLIGLFSTSKSLVYAVTENGQQLFLWLGRDVVRPFLLDLLGVGSLEEVNVSMHMLPIVDTPLNKKVRALLHHIQEETRKGPSLQLQIVRQGEPLERQFLNMLVEDRNNDNMDYPDYLCHVHRMIQNVLQDS